MILVREETNPEDVEGMRAAQGILTARGGMTSHAALVACGWSIAVRAGRPSQEKGHGGRLGAQGMRKVLTYGLVGLGMGGDEDGTDAVMGLAGLRESNAWKT